MCKNLSEVYIENGVESIGRFAFADCKSLKSIFIPNTIKFMADCIFYRPNDYLIIYCEINSMHNEWDDEWNWGGKTNLNGSHKNITTYYNQER